MSAGFSWPCSARLCTAAVKLGVDSAMLPGSKMSAGAVTSKAEPKMKDSSATIEEMIRSSGKPASRSPSLTVSYMARVWGASVTGRTAITGMSGVCLEKTSR
ncbi:hypothetical protein D9M72_610170 [compost metagenome]